MAIYVNRLTRRRHAERSCPALEAAQREIDETNADAGTIVATFDGRVLTLLHDPPPDSELGRFISEFTTPCVRCWPGARELWNAHTQDAHWR